MELEQGRVLPALLGVDGGQRPDVIQDTLKRIAEVIDNDDWYESVFGSFASPRQR